MVLRDWLDTVLNTGTQRKLQQDYPFNRHAMFHSMLLSMMFDGALNPGDAVRNRVDRFAGTIDYIWHTPQLRVRSLLKLPSLQEVTTKL